MDDRGDLGLPRFEIEVTRRRLPEDDAEQVAIRVVATRRVAPRPAAHPALVWAWFGLAPLVAWQAIWAALLGTAAEPGGPPSARPAPSSRPVPLSGRGALNVRPFPGREGRPDERS